MTEKNFLKANDIAQILDVSNATAYRIIKNLNKELKQKGKIILSGKISKRYFEERTYL